MRTIEYEEGDRVRVIEADEEYTGEIATIVGHDNDPDPDSRYYYLDIAGGSDGGSFFSSELEPYAEPIIAEGTISAPTITKGFDPVRVPEHYNVHPSGIEPIQITAHETFFRGNIIKYVMRAPYKGHELEDLLKAQEYLRLEIEKVQNRT